MNDNTKGAMMEERGDSGNEEESGKVLHFLALPVAPPVAPAAAARPLPAADAMDFLQRRHFRLAVLDGCWP